MVSTGEGGILWANRSAEALLGYSSAELTPISNESPGKNWQDLTVDHRDLEADRIMVSQLEEGLREDYQLQKSYRHKKGHPINCQIHVIRWPRSGPVECFLVTIIPLDNATEYIVKELISFRKALVTLQQQQHPPLAMLRDLGRWFDSNRLFGFGLLLFVLAVIAGDKVIETARKILTLPIPP